MSICHRIEFATNRITISLSVYSSKVKSQSQCICVLLLFFCCVAKKIREKHTVNHMHDRLSTHFINWADSIRNIYLEYLLIGPDGNGIKKKNLKSNSHLVIVCIPFTLKNLSM